MALKRKYNYKARVFRIQAFQNVLTSITDGLPSEAHIK